ncbi:MAG: type II toxin-antitoxin system RelE/ParE family toxin [Candidatus Terrybacteria bacterium]|nr:type II toxin-antitoxin system RelE/ParE family toxin [Candidatus Terrybacteria bacterium]
MISYSFTKYADQELQKLPLETQKRIIKKIRFYIESGDPFYFAKSITDSKEKVYRFRIGDYRIFFDYKNNQILITKISPRPKAY